jgi:hypothetical protein
VTVGNKLIDFLIDTTLLCKLSAQITISPEQPYMRVPAGAFLTLSSLESFSSHLGGFTGRREIVYKVLWRKVTDLMGLGSHVNVTFQLARFWFTLVTLVMHRHLVLTASSKSSSTVFSFLSPRTLCKQVSDCRNN